MLAGATEAAGDTAVSGVSCIGVAGAGGVDGPKDCMDWVVRSDCVAMRGVEGPIDCVVSRDCEAIMGVEGPRGLLLPARLPESAKYGFCFRGPRGMRCKLVMGLSCMSFTRAPWKLPSPDTKEEAIVSLLCRRPRLWSSACHNLHGSRKSADGLAAEWSADTHAWCEKTRTPHRCRQIKQAETI